MIESLSYLGFTSPNAEAWTSFGPDVLGLQVAADRGPDGAVRLRMDDAAWRVAIHPGERDDVAYLGWGVSGPPALAAAVERLQRAGVEVTVEDAALATERGVVGLISFDDPFGIRQEVSWGQLARPATFSPGRAHSGFVTGQGGLGHVVLLTPSLEQAESFYCDLLGFRVTDQVTAPRAPRIRFYNCNERHHTLAMIEVPGITGMHHLMLEARSIDDVGTALDLINAGVGGELTQGIGRHSNDRMTSFYVKTPSSFEIEYGYGGVVLDEESKLGQQYDAFSTWGHKPVGGALKPPGIVRVLDPSVAPPPPGAPRTPETVGAH